MSITIWPGKRSKDYEYARWDVDYVDRQCLIIIIQRYSSMVATATVSWETSAGLDFTGYVSLCLPNDTRPSSHPELGPSSEGKRRGAILLMCVRLCKAGTVERTCELLYFSRMVKLRGQCLETT